MISMDKNILKAGNEPLCAAHRGFKSKYPENTVLSIKKAITEGNADIFEADIQVSKDGQLVISHDTNALRCFGVDAPIADTSYDEILSKLKTPDQYQEHMPLFTEIARLLIDYEPFVRNQTIFMLDVKMSNEPWIIQKIMSNLLEIKNDVSFWAQRLVLGIWRPDVLEAAEKYAPSLGVIHIGFSQALAREFLQHSQCIGVSLNYVTWSVAWGLALKKDVTAMGKVSYIWTVNSRKIMEWAIAAKFDGILTDYPDIYRQLLDSRKDLETSASMISPEEAFSRSFSWPQRFVKFPLVYAVAISWIYLFRLRLRWGKHRSYA